MQLSSGSGGLYPVIVPVRDDADYTRALFSSYHSTITGWGLYLCSGKVWARFRFVKLPDFGIKPYKP